MSRTGIVILDKYATYYCKSMRLNGFHVEREDIESELGLAYAKALDSYNGHNQNGAKFKTFVIRCFKNQITDWQRKIIREKRAIPRARVSIESLIDEAGLFKTGEIVAIDKNFTVTFLKQFSGNTLLIAKEMIAPSEKILGLVKAHYAKYEKHAGDKKPNKGNSVIPLAISKTYGLSTQNVYYHVRKIKKKAETMLTNFA